MSWVRWLIVCAVVLWATGCASNPGEAPAGPGAADSSDLRPWLKDATDVEFTGTLLNFNCTSERGCFWTWAITPAGPDEGAEVDIRACNTDASRLENHRVTVSGKLIYREPRHFPLLVADRIESANNPATVSTVAIDNELKEFLGF